MLKIGPDFEPNLLKAARIMVEAHLRKAIPVVEQQIRSLLATTLKASPEYAALLEGELRNLLGIADPAPILDSITMALVASVAGSFIPAAGTHLGGLRVVASRADYSEVLAVPGTTYISVSQKTGTSTLIPWLEWLLRAGDSLIIADWQVYTGSFRPASRTGETIMIKPEHVVPKGFRVPGAYSGTQDNNFLIRTFTAMQPGVESIFRGVVGQ